MVKQGASLRRRLVTGGAVAIMGLAISVAPVLAEGNAVPDSTEDSSFSAYGPNIPYGPPPSLKDAQAERDAFSDNRPIAPAPWNRAASLDLSLASMLFNTVFFPVKLAMGIAGAELGGIAGAANGGSEEAARGIWNVTTDGSYFITPEDLDGRGEFTLGGDAP